MAPLRGDVRRAVRSAAPAQPRTRDGTMADFSTESGTAGSSGRRDLSGAPLIAAARGQAPARRPVWFMRQAGRSLPEYRRVREGIGMLESCFTPELVCEITMQPVRRHGVDGARSEEQQA